MDSAGGNCRGVNDAATAAVLQCFTVRLDPRARTSGVGISAKGGNRGECPDVVGESRTVEEIEFVVVANAVGIAVEGVGTGASFHFGEVGDTISIEIAVSTVFGARGLAVVGDAEAAGEFVVVLEIVIVLIVRITAVGREVLWRDELASAAGSFSKQSRRSLRLCSAYAKFQSSISARRRD